MYDCVSSIGGYIYYNISINNVVRDIHPIVLHIGNYNGNNNRNIVIIQPFY